MVKFARIYISFSKYCWAFLTRTVRYRHKSLRVTQHTKCNKSLICIKGQHWASTHTVWSLSQSEKIWKNRNALKACKLSGTTFIKCLKFTICTCWYKYRLKSFKVIWMSVLCAYLDIPTYMFSFKLGLKIVTKYYPLLS